MSLGCTSAIEPYTNQDRYYPFKANAEKRLETGEQGQYPQLLQIGDLAGCHHAFDGSQGTLLYGG